MPTLRYKRYNLILCTMLTVVCFLNSRGMLEFHKSDGIGAVGGIKWELLLCLLAVLLVVYFALWKGVKTSGKVAININVSEYVEIRMFFENHKPLE